MQIIRMKNLCIASRLLSHFSNDIFNLYLINTYKTYNPQMFIYKQGSTLLVHKWKIKAVIWSSVENQVQWCVLIHDHKMVQNLHCVWEWLGDLTDTRCLIFIRKLVRISFTATVKTNVGIIVFQWILQLNFLKSKRQPGYSSDCWTQVTWLNKMWNLLHIHNTSSTINEKL